MDTWWAILLACVGFYAVFGLLGVFWYWVNFSDHPEKEFRPTRKGMLRAFAGGPFTCILMLFVSVIMLF
jgi:hypothetical protein